jgi:hypothetical protein
VYRSSGVWSREVGGSVKNLIDESGEKRIKLLPYPCLCQSKSFANR